jgi:tRNA nucleotidyltransferase (CCA-adding enzyme)
MHADTELLLRRDTALMDRVSGDRHRHELERILEEERPERPLQRADELGALRYLSPSLRGNDWLAERFERTRRANAESTRDGVLYLTLLAWRLDQGEIDSFISRLNFGREAARALRDIPSLKKTLFALGTEAMAPSHIYRLLERHNARTILAAALATESELVRQRLALYLSNLRFVETSLSGEDLKRLGVPQGRKLGSMLRALRDARLDGDVTDRSGEQDLVRRWLDQSGRRGHRLG